MKHFLVKYQGLLLLAVVVIIGLRTYKSYGISWDEGDIRHLGIVSYNYVFHGEDTLSHFDCRDHGAGYEMPVVMLEKVMGLKDSRDIFLMRHLVTHLLFLLGAFALFLLIDYIYQDKLLATIGLLLLLLNPLIYGHSFFNSKDIPFLSIFIICFLLTAVAFRRNKLIWYILLGIGCGVLTSIRVMSVLLIFLIILFFIIDIYASRADKEPIKKTVRNFLFFSGTCLLVLYMAWPFLYPNPIHNFMYAYRSMSHFPWEGYVLFFGTSYKSTAIPLYYGIGWFCISNPITYLITGFGGLIYFIARFLKTPKPFLFDKELRLQTLFVFCFAQPIIMVVILHSVLYDAWRQLYFIYPSFILVGIYGLNYVFKTKAKLPVLIILFASMGYTGYYMVSNFPHEHIYFNELVKRDEPEYLRKNFELDYWGTSYRQAFDYILKTDTAKTITVSVCHTWPGIENTWLLKSEDRKRIVITKDPYAADYTVTFYREHPQDYPFQNKEVYTEKVYNSRIMSVFKMK